MDIQSCSRSSPSFPRHGTDIIDEIDALTIQDIVPEKEIPLEKVPCEVRPKICQRFSYVDADGILRGPYAEEQLQEWYRKRCFSSTTRFLPEDDDSTDQVMFLTLSALIECSGAECPFRVKRPLLDIIRERTILDLNWEKIKRRTCDLNDVKLKIEKERKRMAKEREQIAISKSQLAKYEAMIRQKFQELEEAVECSGLSPYEKERLDVDECRPYGCTSRFSPGVMESRDRRALNGREREERDGSRLSYRPRSSTPNGYDSYKKNNVEREVYERERYPEVDPYEERRRRYPEERDLDYRNGHRAYPNQDRMRDYPEDEDFQQPRRAGAYPTCVLCDKLGEMCDDCYSNRAAPRYEQRTMYLERRPASELDPEDSYSHSGTYELDATLSSGARDDFEDARSTSCSYVSCTSSPYRASGNYEH